MGIAERLLVAAVELGVPAVGTSYCLIGGFGLLTSATLSDGDARFSSSIHRLQLAGNSANSPEEKIRLRSAGEEWRVLRIRTAAPRI